MSNWVSVDDVLPNEGQEVRFYAASNKAFNGWYHDKCFYRGDYYFWIYYDEHRATEKLKYIGSYCVTAIKGWTPLLQPPGKTS